MQAGEDIGLTRVGDADEGVGILEALLLEEFNVGGVAMDDKGVVEQGAEFLGTPAVLLYESDAHLVLQCHSGIASNSSTTSYHGVADAHCLLPHHAVDGLHLIGTANDVSQVTSLKYCVAVRDDGVSIAQKGHHTHLQVGMQLGEFLDIVSRYGRPCIEANDIHGKQASTEVEELGGDGVIQKVGDFLGGDTLGANHLVNPQVSEHLAMLGAEEFCVGNACHCLLGFQLLSQDAGHQIDTLLMEHREEKVTISNIGILKHLRRGAVARDGEQVSLTLKTFKQLGMRVHHGDIMVQFGKRLRQVYTHFAVASNNNIHPSRFQKRAAKIHIFLQ